MLNNTSFLGYFTGAGPVVQAVMLILLAGSVASWMLIFQRWWFLTSMQLAAKKFEEKFWSGAELARLFADIDNHPEKKIGLAHIFHSGFKEYMRIRQYTTQPSVLVEGVQRSMRIAQAREADKLETHLSVLASIGSTSPFIALFGTVWGIMTTFQALGQVQQATIATVAPGISEALVATALGLFTAVPAVLAYNRFTNDVNRLQNQSETFQEEFSNILYRQCISKIGSEHHASKSPA